MKTPLHCSTWCRRLSWISFRDEVLPLLLGQTYKAIKHNRQHIWGSHEKSMKGLIMSKWPRKFSLIHLYNMTKFFYQIIKILDLVSLPWLISVLKQIWSSESILKFSALYDDYLNGRQLTLLSTYYQLLMIITEHF